MVSNKILNIKVKREIKSNWKQYLSVVIIALLAVTLFTGIWANYRDFQERLNIIYENTNMCDGIIMTKTYDNDIEQYLKEQGIIYQKRIYFPSKCNNNPIYLVTFTEDDIMNLPYNGNLKNQKVLVDQKFLDRCDLRVGDKFQINYNFEIGNFKYSITPTFEISGTMIHPESLENTSYNPSLIYVNYSYLKEMICDAIKQVIDIDENIIIENVEKQLTMSINQFLIKNDKPDFIINKINMAFKENDSFLYALETKNLPSNMAIEADVTQAKKLLYIFPVIFYLVALLIILTSISQLINREQKNIGILKALGYTRWEILNHYIKIYIILGLIGSIFGMILGPIIIPRVMNMKYNILYQLPEIPGKLFRLEFFISVIILTIIIIITSILACFKTTSLTPAVSLRGENSVKLSINKIFKFIKRLPLSCLMAFRNMRRKISRTVMVIIGVLGCSSLLVCGFGIEDTINYGLDLELNQLIPYDVSVSYINSNSHLEELKLNNEVIDIDEYAKYNVNIGKIGKVISSFVYVLPTNSKVINIKYDEKSCIISSKVANEINCNVGDEISLFYKNEEFIIRITEIVDFCISQGIFISIDYFGEDKLEFKPSGAWIRTNNENINDKLADDISLMEGIGSAYSIQTMRNKANDTIGSIKVMTLTIKIFAILLSIVVLYNLALLNFKERIKDIATLKVLGFSKFEIGSTFIIEIIFLTFIGSLIGLIFGKPLLIAVLSINENPLMSYIYHINLISYIWTILLTCGSSFIINIMFAYLTNNVKMVESLKAVE